MKPVDIMHRPPYGLKDFLDNTHRHGLGSALEEDWYVTKERATQILEECIIDSLARIISIAYSPVFHR